MLGSHFVADITAKHLLEHAAQRHVRAPDFGVTKVEAQHQQVGVLTTAGIPGSNIMGPVAVDDRRIALFRQRPVDTSEEIMTLGGKLRHRGTACRQPVIFRRVEPEAMIGPGIELRRHRQAMFVGALKADHQKGALCELGPEAVTDVGLVAHLLSPVGEHRFNRRKRREVPASVRRKLDLAQSCLHIAAMLIETEPTPNPATVKFIPGRVVMGMGTRDFATPEEAEASPLAAALFGLGDVTGVFFGGDFISVTIAPGSQWNDVKPEILSILLEHFSANMPLFAPGSAGEITVPAEEEFADDPADAEIVAQIKDLIDTRVRPAVANDGGDIVYRGFDRGTVFLRMHGACAGCPSSTATLKNGIEQLLKHYVPEVTEVRAV